MNTAELDRREVVTAFLSYEGRVLLVRRSGRVGSYRGHWSAISGYLAEATPLAQAWRVISEETGLAGGVHLIHTGTPLEVPDTKLGVCWVVHPFLFEIEDPEGVHLDWENTELTWAVPEEIDQFKTVPALAEALDSVWPPDP